MPRTERCRNRPYATDCRSGLRLATRHQQWRQRRCAASAASTDRGCARENRYTVDLPDAARHRAAVAQAKAQSAIGGPDAKTPSAVELVVELETRGPGRSGRQRIDQPPAVAEPPVDHDHRKHFGVFDLIEDRDAEPDPVSSGINSDRAQRRPTSANR